MKSVLTWPFTAARGLIGGLLLVCAFLLKSVWTSFWFVAEVATVAVVGVLVGGIVGWATANPADVEATMVSHAAIGGALATVVALFLSVRERWADRTTRVARYRFDSAVLTR
jgi:hypothetical protein